MEPETALKVEKIRRFSTWAGEDTETGLSQKWIPETADSTEAGVDPETALRLART